MTRCYHIRQRRERQGLSQHDLGVLLDPTMRWPAQWLGKLERVDDGTAPPHTYSAKRIQDVRQLLLSMETKVRCRRKDLRHDEERVAFQRSLWAALPDHPAVRALKAAMIDRCIDLMHAGKGEETDAIADFLPGDDVDAMFDRWERESIEATADWVRRREEEDRDGRS